MRERKQYDNLKNLPNVLLALRKSKNLTRLEVSNLSKNIKPQVVYNLETGKNLQHVGFYLSVMADISKIYDISINDIIKLALNPKSEVTQVEDQH